LHSSESEHQLEAEIPADSWPELSARPQPWIAYLPPERILLLRA
jgi:hypothetical protein